MNDRDGAYITDTFCADEVTIEFFADIIGDHNPLHTDESYVEQDETFADENIVHGALIQGWFSNLANRLGDELGADIVLAETYTEFHNPLPVGRETTCELSIDAGDLDEEMVIVDAYVRSVDPANNNEYATGTVTLMIDQTVSRGDGNTDWSTV